VAGDLTGNHNCRWTGNRYRRRLLWGYALSFGLSGLHAVQASKHTVEHTVPRDVLIARICALVEKHRLSEPKLLPSLKPQPIDAEYQELETSDAERVTVQSAAVGNFRS